MSCRVVVRGQRLPSLLVLFVVIVVSAVHTSPARAGEVTIHEMSASKLAYGFQGLLNDKDWMKAPWPVHLRVQCEAAPNTTLRRPERMTTSMIATTAEKIRVGKTKQYATLGFFGSAGDVCLPRDEYGLGTYEMFMDGYWRGQLDDSFYPGAVSDKQWRKLLRTATKLRIVVMQVKYRPHRKEHWRNVVTSRRVLAEQTVQLSEWAVDCEWQTPVITQSDPSAPLLVTDSIGTGQLISLASYKGPAARMHLFTFDWHVVAPASEMVQLSWLLDGAVVAAAPAPLPIWNGQLWTSSWPQTAEMDAFLHPEISVSADGVLRTITLRAQDERGAISDASSEFQCRRTSGAGWPFYSTKLAPEPIDKDYR